MRMASVRDQLELAATPANSADPLPEANRRIEKPRRRDPQRRADPEMTWDEGGFRWPGRTACRLSAEQESAVSDLTRNRIAVRLRFFEAIPQDVHMFECQTGANGNARERIIGDVAGNAGHLGQQIR